MPIQCDDCIIIVLKNLAECKKHKNYGQSVVKFHLIYTFEFLKITSRMWSPEHAIHSCNGLQRMFIDGPNFILDVLFQLSKYARFVHIYFHRQLYPEKAVRCKYSRRLH